MVYHVYLKLSQTFFVVIDPVYPVFGCQHHVKVGCYGGICHHQGQNERSENAIMVVGRWLLIHRRGEPGHHLSL